MWIVLHRYISIGVINTILHWSIFLILFYLFLISQAFSNFIAFSITVTFSFIANSKWTFRSKATLSKYISFTFFMGFLSIFLGYLADIFNLPIIITLISFSFLSLIFGFLYSRFVVFKEKK